MPVEAWFGTPIYWEEVPLSEETRALVMDAVTDVIPASWEELRKRREAYTVEMTKTLHLDERMAPFFQTLRPAIHRFVYEELGCDPERTRLFTGRCRPVIQSPGGSGNFHNHAGSTLSGVFFLRAPEGSGGIEFLKPWRTSLDGLPTTRDTRYSFNTVTYEAEENRLVLFTSDLFHRARASKAADGELRIVIAFDFFAFSDIRLAHSGLPHLEHLKPLE